MNDDLNLRSPLSVAAIICVTAIALWLQATAVSKQSFSGDAVYHLIAGHQALRYGNNTVNLEHPPLAKLVFALPAALEESALAPPLTASEALASINEVHLNPELLFKTGRRGRYLALAVFVIPLWLSTFFLGRRFGGPRAGLALMSMTALSFLWVSNACILQTDAAAALGFLLTILACYQLQEHQNIKTAAIVGLALGFTLAAKHSAVILGPVVVMTVTSLYWRGQTKKKCALLLAATSVTALVTLEAFYGLANLGPNVETHTIATVEAYCHGTGTLIVGDHMLRLEPALRWLAATDPRLAQWITGVFGIAAQNSIGVYPSYAFGQVSFEGRWWYFPILLAVKLPLVTLVIGLFCLAGWVSTGKSARLQPLRFITDPVVMTLVLYFLSAITSNYNLGVRHMLPILPLALLPIARAVSKRAWGWFFLAVVLAVESLLLAPSWMCATNTWWLGSLNPSRFAFGAGNTEYRQNFFLLAEEAERRDMQNLKVVYPTLSEPVLHAYLPGADLVDPADELEPGWYAVNVMVEQYVPALVQLPGPGLGDLARQWSVVWAQIRNGEDHGYGAGTFHFYRVETDKDTPSKNVTNLD